MNMEIANKEKYFEHDDNIGIIGHGDSVESCFENIARTLFSLIADIENIHSLQVISIEFEEENVVAALRTWLAFLLEKSKEQQILFGDFRLRREGNHWKATVSGEPLRMDLLQGVEVKGVDAGEISVNKINLIWEARCVVEV